MKHFVRWQQIDFFVQSHKIWERDESLPLWPLKWKDFGDPKVKTFLAL